MKIPAITCLVLLALLATASGQPAAPRPAGGGSTPREHEVHSATSKDGLNWTRDEGIPLKSASVPCVIDDGGRRILLSVVRRPDEPVGVAARRREGCACRRR